MRDLKMRVLGWNKKRLVLLLAIPALFLLIVYLLSGNLKSASDDGKSERGHLVASRRDAGQSLRERAWDLLHTNDPLDKKYDVKRLTMLGEIKTDEDEQIRDKGDADNSFNDLVSSRLSLNRVIPDVRHKLCNDKKYRPILPKASVIICFYNEAWSALLRTVHSVLNRTPSKILQEIILVDDASDMAHLQGRLAEYVWMIHPNVTLVRTAKREGLTRARMYGARVASGEVLVFLDSHCEVGTQWLEPLLDHIADNKRAIAIPVIDIINPDTFEYSAAALVRGGFTWGLFFRWDSLPPNYFKDEKAKTDPLESPTMAGGLFAINRKFFYDMGQYDKELDTWGGENLEMSFRMWLCGGRLDMIPCSRVGHIFRKRRPYGSILGPDSTLRNSVRVARVWLDEYIEHFFSSRPIAAKIEYGNITERLELKKKLNCKPFSWYLKYIYTDQVLPGEKQKNLQKSFQNIFTKKGKITHVESGLCLSAETQKDVPSRGSRLILSKCSDNDNDKFQMWRESTTDELVLYKNLCLHVEDHHSKKVFVRINKCAGGRGPQAWVWKIQHVVYQLYNLASGKCLVPTEIENVTYLTLEICSTNKNSAFKMVEKR